MIEKVSKSHPLDFQMSCLHYIIRKKHKRMCRGKLVLWLTNHVNPITTKETINNHFSEYFLVNKKKRSRFIADR